MDHHRPHDDHQPLVLQRIHEAGALSGPYRCHLALGLLLILFLTSYQTLTSCCCYCYLAFGHGWIILSQLCKTALSSALNYESFSTLPTRYFGREIFHSFPERVWNPGCLYGKYSKLESFSKSPISSGFGKRIFTAFQLDFYAPKCCKIQVIKY